jgi:hypothetical protein
MRYGQKLKEVAIQVGGNRNELREFYLESVAAGKIDTSRVSIRELAQSFMGDNWKDVLTSYANGGERFMESTAAIGASGFAVISGQLMVDQILEGYKIANTVIDRLYSPDPITNGNLGTQIEPGLGDVLLGDDTQAEMEAAPYVQFNGRYIQVPAPISKRNRAALTMEMIFSDKTGQATDKCKSVGKMMGVWQAEQIYKCIYGITNPYKEAFTQSSSGTAYNTYITSAGAGPWANKLTNFSLTDWTSIDTLEQLFAGMTDPFTGKRIQVTPNAILVSRANKYTAKRILSATQVRAGNITSGTGNQTLSESPLDVEYPVEVDNIANAVLKSDGVTASVVANAAQADSLVVLADFKKAFGWRYVPEIGPGVKVTDLPISGEKMSQHIVMECMAELFGTAYVRDPRYAVLAYNNSL